MLWVKHMNVQSTEIPAWSCRGPASVPWGPVLAVSWPGGLPEPQQWAREVPGREETSPASVAAGNLQPNKRQQPTAISAQGSTALQVTQSSWHFWLCLTGYGWWNYCSGVEYYILHRGQCWWPATHLSTHRTAEFTLCSFLCSIYSFPHEKKCLFNIHGFF